MAVNQLECYLNRALEFLADAIFTMAQQPTVGQGLIIIEASLSHTDTLQSVGLLWTSDQSVAETST
jgi:hypothetical protein